MSTSITFGPWAARAVAALGVLVAAVLLSVTLAGPASASVTYCGNGRCTIYLSQAETLSMSKGKTPPIAAIAPPPIRVAYTITMATHRWIAAQYAKRHWCSAFTLNVRPAATQGYYGYSCSWRK